MRKQALNIHYSHTGGNLHPPGEPTRMCKKQMNFPNHLCLFKYYTACIYSVIQMSSHVNVSW